MKEGDGAFTIERRATAHGTTLERKDTPIVIITFRDGKKGVFGSWTTLQLPKGCVQATEASDDQLRRAFDKDPSGWLGIARVTEVI